MNKREVRPFTMWRHFKGARAFVITLAQHSETGENLVVYRCMDNNGKQRMEFMQDHLKCFYQK